MDFTLDPPDSGSPSWASSTPRPGRLQFWVDMANGPGFDVGSPELDSQRPDEEVVDAMARHPSTPSAHSAIFGTSDLSSSDKPHGGQDPRSPGNILPPRSLSATAEAPPLSGQHAQIVTRSGRMQVAEDGHSRYFGATSNLHLIHNGPYSSFSPSLKNIRVDGELAINSAGLQWAGDPAYEAHLWECYLTWLNPLTNLIKRNLFDQDKENYMSSLESDFYSPALESAMRHAHNAPTPFYHGRRMQILCQ
ncbi:hypothetical protein Neosp_009789 [[Neocosmospora] mangrovei]